MRDWRDYFGPTGQLMAEQGNFDDLRQVHSRTSTNRLIWWARGSAVLRVFHAVCHIHYHTWSVLLLRVHMIDTRKLVCALCDLGNRALVKERYPLHAHIPILLERIGDDEDNVIDTVSLALVYARWDESGLGDL